LKMVIFNWLKGYFSHPQKILFQASSHLPQQLKFTTSDSCDRIKDEFQLLQAQYHSLKLECDKLASEKSEMQRHYVMVSFALAIGGALVFISVGFWFWILPLCPKNPSPF
uniref:TLE family member 5, transcriptional modulator n=1 Tax=Naja naja TaxID=35670 RepID=A0A8C6VDG7_NAJNA